MPPLIETPGKWPISTVDTGYDQSRDTTQSITLTTPANSNWDITMSANHPPGLNGDQLPEKGLIRCVHDIQAKIIVVRVKISGR